MSLLSGVCRRQQKLLLKAIEEAKDKGRYRFFWLQESFLSHSHRLYGWLYRIADTSISSVILCWCERDHRSSVVRREAQMVLLQEPARPLTWTHQKFYKGFRVKARSRKPGSCEEALRLLAVPQDACASEGNSSEPRGNWGKGEKRSLVPLSVHSLCLDSIGWKRNAHSHRPCTCTCKTAMFVLIVTLNRVVLVWVS